MSRQISVYGPGRQGVPIRAEKRPGRESLDAGLPIVHVEYKCKWARGIRSRWDKMLFPLPFDELEIKYHEPVFVGSDEPDDDDAVCRKLELKFLGKKKKVM